MLKNTGFFFKCANKMIIFFLKSSFFFHFSVEECKQELGLTTYA